MKIGVIDHSFGNVGSLADALRFYNYDVNLINSKSKLEDIDIIFLSGVGRFDTMADNLKKLDLWNALDDCVVNQQKPIVGIGLGMQLFADDTEECLNSKGFGWISGHIKKINYPDVKVPHIGWDDVIYSSSPIFRNIKGNTFYFMHNYHYITDDESVIKAVAHYGSNDIVSCIAKDNIVGFQFYPEKSQRDGLRILKNVVEEFKCSIRV